MLQVCYAADPKAGASTSSGKNDKVSHQGPSEANSQLHKHPIDDSLSGYGNHCVPERFGHDSRKRG